MWVQDGHSGPFRQPAVREMARQEIPAKPFPVGPPAKPFPVGPPAKPFPVGPPVARRPPPTPGGIFNHFS